MKLYQFVAATAALLVTLPLATLAQECEAGCPTGQRMTSYGDGNNANCVCVEDGAMDETSEVGYDPLSADPSIELTPEMIEANTNNP